MPCVSILMAPFCSLSLDPRWLRNRWATAIEMTLHIDISLETCFDIIHYLWKTKEKNKRSEIRHLKNV